MADPDSPRDAQQERSDAHRQAKDLERVTDYAEEKELDTAKVSKAMSELQKAHQAEQEAQAAKERELAAVVISKDDVELLERELEITKLEAERLLREHKGNAVSAIRAFISV
mmetsp:Transcript_9697/g.16835  ORF Transcript_9697/g.16835 Transcript_9697/m.16835 type:complete len:112 (-) Transcript_9697:398-733(-)|eukprot:CAMPEP_0196657342 /NCGR_PEP_ID=MMETSP1086-20130531/22646_1 /TAXON_ID=77921 /ORGANISM="Cyanoptyche  gloeocystis , Strain SAG4.97" /LENGTH=111 /DNA_ID=CAMNT_0041990413 /DNA_START=51 /DNA_END=386 /DNA_ORIENTATION=+